MEGENIVDDALSRKEKPIQVTSVRIGIISRLPDLIRQVQKVAERLENLKQIATVNYIIQLV